MTRKLKWKQRLKNRTFVISFVTAVLALVYEILALAGVTPKIGQDDAATVAVMIVNILSVLGIVVDPTTPGISDGDKKE